LAEVQYKAALSNASSSTPEETARGLSEAVRRYLRSIELCDNYLRGYYGLKLATKHLMDALPKAGEGEGLITLEKAETLNELATLKLWEIVRSAQADRKGWDGYDKAELVATRELLEKDELAILGDAKAGR
jgi:hypothetical protein